MHSKARLYSNTALLHPDGSVLCYVDDRKANWYVRKGLGEKQDGQNAVKLLFKPAGCGANKVPFMVEPRKNICVVCGKPDDLTLHHVVPVRYRRLLPIRAKRHGSYDVLGLCSECHRKYEDVEVQRKFQRLLKRRFRSRYFRSLNHYEFHEAAGAARSLRKHGDKIPASRKRVLRQKIAKYLGRWPKPAEVLILGKNRRRSPPKQIMGRFPASREIARFVRAWRRHFIETMRPKHLSPLWKVNAPVFIN